MRCKYSKNHCEKLRCEKFRNIMACFEKEEALIFTHETLFLSFRG